MATVEINMDSELAQEIGETITSLTYGTELSNTPMTEQTTGAVECSGNVLNFCHSGLTPQEENQLFALITNEQV